MMNTHSLKTLLLGTALALPAFGATTASAQQQDACVQLEQQVQQADLTGTAYTEEEFIQVVQTGDPEECQLWLQELQAVATDTQPADAATATAEAEVEAVVEETQRARITLEDEVVIEGQVWVDQQPPQVQVEEAPVEVMIGRSQPDVTVTEQPAEIVIRQAAPTIRLDMPTPTITIEQPAPEIIVTMPPPGVDVASAQPTVEVRQAEPRVSVTQAQPQVELNLYQAEDPEGTEGVEIARRPVPEGQAAAEPQVTLSRSDAQVIYDQDTEVAEPRVSVARAQPSVRFEQAEPQIEMSEQPQPQISWTQIGEATVTFQEAADQTGEQPADAQQQAAMEEQPTDDAVQQEQLTEQQMQEQQQGQDQVQQQAAAPGTGMVEREGYQQVAATDVQVTELTGANVFGVNDEEIGQVGDLIVGEDQQVQEAVIDVGGFLGIGERNVRVPFDDLTVLRAEDGTDLRVYMDATQEQLETYPEVDG